MLDSIVPYPWLRAGLSVTLLRMGRFEEAQAATTPLVGTPYQAWFLYASACREWTFGCPSRARQLLKNAFDLGGPGVPNRVSLEQSPLFYLESFAHPTSPQVPKGPDLLCNINQRVAVWRDETLSFGAAERMYYHLYPILAVCVSCFDIVQESFGNDVAPPCLRKALRNRASVRDTADGLRRLITTYGNRSLALSGGAAFFLILDQRYAEAVEVCEAYLIGRPSSSHLRGLRALALYRMGRRHRAFEIWRSVIEDESDSDGQVHLILALLAFEEGHHDVARRYVHEAVVRGNSELAQEAFAAW